MSDALIRFEERLAEARHWHRQMREARGSARDAARREYERAIAAARAALGSSA